MSRHFSIDALTARHGRVFGWGWFLDTDSMSRGAELTLPLVGGGVATVACLEGATRPDVAAAFPGVPHAANTGFMVMAQLPSDVDPHAEARFVACLQNGERHEIALSMESLLRRSAPRRGLRAALGRLRQLGLPAIASGVVRRSATAAHSVATWVTRTSLRVTRRRVVVLFDHALGGGANSFRDSRIADLLAQGRAVVRVSPDVQHLDYVLELSTRPGESAQWRVATLEAVLATLSRFALGGIEVNNLVSFDDPLRVVRWCVERRAAGTELVFFLHDFHAVCPAFTLIDAQGRYCGVPEPDACRACLPRNAANLLGFPAPADTREWRDAWGALLLAADRVVAFSDASVRILARAFPGLIDRVRLELRPHRPDHSHLRPVRRVPSDIVTVGVIGNISRPKGADVVNALARLAESRALPLRIVIIGTLQSGGASNPHLHVHGAFAANELPDLIERYRVDVCLMPSVCPETYSYVTDEIMAMDMPIVVFGIGAPAERVARYTRGAVTADITAEAALADIMRLAERAHVPL